MNDVRNGALTIIQSSFIIYYNKISFWYSSIQLSQAAILSQN